MAGQIGAGEDELLFRNRVVQVFALVVESVHGQLANEQDLERLKLAEAARMSWCLADVHEVHGPTGIYEDGDLSHWHGQGEVIYPDINPSGLEPGTFTPQPTPIDQLELSPAPEEIDRQTQPLPPPESRIAPFPDE